MKGMGSDRLVNYVYTEVKIVLLGLLMRTMDAELRN